MIRKIHLVKYMRERAAAQAKSSCENPRMSVEKWYELQHQLRLQQMAQARAVK